MIACEARANNAVAPQFAVFCNELMTFFIFIIRASFLYLDLTTTRK